MADARARAHGFIESKAKKLIVASLSIGITWSECAYSMKHEFEAKTPKIHALHWVSNGNLISSKTPTVLLLNKKQEFIAFGFEAEDEYAQLEKDGRHEDYYYFKDFNTNLFTHDHLKRETATVIDERNKPMDAVKVFSICIKYLVDRCLKNIRTRVSEVTDNDLYWVLTVPSTSNDGSKQFMREAAQKVGLKNDRLTIALESEVALLSCMHLPIEIFTIRGFNQKDSQLPLFSIGQQIMVAVFKENTVNTTVYEIVGKGQLKELISTSGGACGDALVDEAFEDFIKKIVGNDVYNTFKISCIEDWLDLQHNFKVTKRFFKPDRDGQETILIPVALSETYMAMTKNELQIAVDKVGFAGKVKLIAGKIRISRDIMSEWYKESCENTVKHLKELFKHDSCIRTVNIVLVGDFAESRMLQKALTDAFPNKRFIVPEATGLAVLNGAVLYGHDPITIVSRVAKFSYGVLVFRDFIEGQHPKEKMEQCGDRLKCKDVFGKHITKGQDLVVGEAQASQRYIPSYADQESFVFDIYASPDTDPKFITDDGCTHIGRLEVEIPGSGKDRAVWVGMVYGGTEIIVLAKDEKTGKEAKTTLDFL